MDEYDCIKKTSLKFKGDSKKKKKKKHSRQDGSSTHGDAANQQQDERVEDAECHGGWWKVDKYEHIQNEVAIEFIPGCYAKALGNGSIVLGHPHPPGEGPDEEEIFTAVCASTNQIAFKSGFGRYLGVDTRKRLMGLSEAISEQETFLPVFEDGKLALCAYTECFLSPDEESEPQFIVAKAEKAGPYEMLAIRVNNDPIAFSIVDGAKKDNTQEDAGNLYKAEVGYLKKSRGEKQTETFQGEDIRRIKKARVDGQLHEALLDTRVKYKSDKYCK